MTSRCGLEVLLFRVCVLLICRHFLLHGAFQIANYVYVRSVPVDHISASAQEIVKARKKILLVKILLTIG